jgi:hypothetical protein
MFLLARKIKPLAEKLQVELVSRGAAVSFSDPRKE